MKQIRTAKLFKNGRSLAVRLPKDFRLEGKVVAIFRLGNAIVLQPINKTWLDVYHSMVELPDFMEEREDLPLQEREQL